MPRAKPAVTQADIARVAKGMRAAGAEAWRMVVERPDGTKFSIFAGEPSADTQHDDIDALIKKVPDP